jgi:cell division septation protein DedD
MMKHLLLPLLALVPAALAAQTPADTTPKTAADSALIAARVLINEGKEVEGRKTLDSLVRVSSPDEAIYAEALYWRGNMAATAADAERDYRRLLIEAPLHHRAEDALLRLANLLQARGDRRGASDHLQRYMLTYADSPARPRVALSLVRLLFEQGPQQQARACEALRMGRDAIPRENFELRNQLEYYEPRCVAELAPAPAAPAAASTTDSTATAPADSARPAPAAPAPAAPSTPTATKAAPPSAFYSVQVAAYNSREPAQSLVNLLVERGIEARIDGTAAPFRVRVGKYTTRADAVKAAATLKSQGHNGFITLVK